MDMELIERLAKEAYDSVREQISMHVVQPVFLEQFAALVAEECARIAAGTYEGDCSCDDDSSGFSYYGENSAEEIRARFGIPLDSAS